MDPCLLQGRISTTSVPSILRNYRKHIYSFVFPNSNKIFRPIMIGYSILISMSHVFYCFQIDSLPAFLDNFKSRSIQSQSMAVITLKVCLDNLVVIDGRNKATSFHVTVVTAGQSVYRVPNYVNYRVTVLMENMTALGNWGKYILKLDLTWLWMIGFFCSVISPFFFRKVEHRLLIKNHVHIWHVC